MMAFKILLIAMIAIIFTYTGVVMFREGADFLTPFFEAVLSITWGGQFALDFACYLVFSALWVMWRHGFSIGGILFGLVCGLMGFVVFAPYLLLQTFRAPDVRSLVLGPANTSQK